MFAVRLVALTLLALYGWGMGQEPELNAFGKIVALSFFVTFPALYMLPTYEAWKRKHVNLSSIALVNFFFGWSLIGWVIAAAWAFKKPEALPPKAVESDTKPCPYCAEQVLFAAIKCKHCGSDLPT